MIIATAGHVDHGKTSLVKHLTGIDTDTLAEEKSRGLTINLGFAYRQLDDHLLGFVDVPGHVDFINNMLAGIAAVDCALLVIAVDDGIMPQTREHLDIIRLLGVRRLALVLTKIDRVDAARCTAVKNEAEQLLRQNDFLNPPAFMISNLNGDGIEDLLEFLQTTASALATQTDQHRQQQLPRYSIDRRFSVKGIGTVVTGTLLAGSVAVGDTLSLSRTGEKVKIRGIRLDHNDVTAIVAGTRAAFTVNVGVNALERGDWLMAPQQRYPTFSFDARLTGLGDALKIIDKTSRVHLYHGAGHYLADVKRLQFSESGLPIAECWVQVKTQTPLFGFYGDRFIIRNASDESTLGGGSIVDMFPPARHRHTTQRYQYLSALNTGIGEGIFICANLEKSGLDLNRYAALHNVDADNLKHHVKSALVDPALLPELLNSTATESGYWQFDLGAKSVLLAQHYWLKYARNLLDQLRHYHQQMPARQGLSDAQLQKKFTGPKELLSLILNSLLSAEVISRTRAEWHLPEHEAKLDSKDKDFYQRLKIQLQKNGYEVPRTRELAEIFHLDLSRLDMYLERLTAAGLIAKIATNRYYLPETLLALAGEIETLVAAAPNGRFTVIQFRDRIKIGRNVCIQILEYFDRQGFTMRVDNDRLIHKSKETVFSQ